MKITKTLNKNHHNFDKIKINIFTEHLYYGVFNQILNSLCVTNI